jgi:hypothetical protein
MDLKQAINLMLTVRSIPLVTSSGTQDPPAQSIQSKATIILSPRYSIVAPKDRQKEVENLEKVGEFHGAAESDGHHIILASKKQGCTHN